MPRTKHKIHKRVPKKWGEEIWIVNNPDINYCGKILVLNKGFRCSFHHHKIKTETFYILEGTVYFELEKNIFYLHEGDSVHIHTGQNHRFSGVEDSQILEISTFHREDDSYREELSGKVPENVWEEIKDG